ncbi:hypothetical protein [Streptomyces sp. 1114.5]|uniref:hypothetical protein n=1 Tax=Streptomyces sp. 1114.5 TaxID=1938830 RepID=UPI0015FFF2E9|nr:hypothetical protein [Streptomyces sp. 1114.5]
MASLAPDILSAIGKDHLANLDLHDPDCVVPPGPGHVLVQDHRVGADTVDALHR